PTMPPPSRELDEDMDDEDRRRYERSLRKKEAKDYAKTQEAVLDELLPKATGREAMIEKKKARNAHYRREASPDLELDDDALLGGDDFNSRLAARDRAKAAREDRKQQYMAEKAANVREKIVAYKSKEQETMEMFRKIAEEQKKAGGGLWGESRGNG
ncbi:492_t:CDS:2, partial [Paraglomus occultum]